MVTLILVIANLMTLLALLLVLKKYGLVSKFLDRYMPSLKSAANRDLDPSQNPFFRVQTDLFASYAAVQNQAVLVGDSHIHRANWDELLTTKVLNRGISSDTLKGVQNRVSSIAALNSSHCVVMIGTNDVLNGVDARKIVDMYGAIVDSLKENVGFLTLCSIPYVGIDKAGALILNKKIEDINRQLARMAAEFGANFLNVNTILGVDKQLNKQYTHDEVHLNGKGYLKFAELLQSHLNITLTKSSSV